MDEHPPAEVSTEEPSAEVELPTLDLETLTRIYQFHIALLLIAGCRITLTAIKVAVLPPGMLPPLSLIGIDPVLALWLGLIACQLFCIGYAGRLAKFPLAWIRMWTILSLIPAVGVVVVIAVAGWLRMALRHNQVQPSTTGLDTSHREGSR